MKWIFENLFTLLIIASVVAQLVKAVRGKKDGDDEAAPAQPKEYEFEDPELAERTRKIREEIQRKIAERQRGGAEAPPMPMEESFDEPPPVLREVVVTRAEPPPVAAAPVLASARWDTQRTAEVLEQQVALAEKLREAELMKAAAIRRAAFETQTTDATAAARGQARGDLLGDLRDRTALRRAFVMREVLGPPVALR